MNASEVEKERTLFLFMFPLLNGITKRLTYAGLNYSVKKNAKIIFALKSDTHRLSN